MSNAGLREGTLADNFELIFSRAIQKREVEPLPRGKFYQQFKILDEKFGREIFTIRPEDVRKGKAYVMRLGLPIWVKDVSGKYVPKIVEKVDDQFSIQSGKVSYKISKGNKLEYYGIDDVKMERSIVTETLKLILDGQPATLSWRSWNKEETDADVAITQTFSIPPQGKNKGGEFEVIYDQTDGNPLRHIITTKNLLYHSEKSLEIIWDFPEPIDGIEVENEEGVNKIIAEDIELFVPNDDIVGVEVIRNDKFLIGEIVNNEYLDGMKVSRKRIAWVYSGWGGGQLDLQYGQVYTWPSINDPVEDGYVVDGVAAKKTGPSFYEVSIRGTSSGGLAIRRGYFEWDISPLAAAMPAPTDIVSVTIVFHASLTNNTAREYRRMTVQPSLIDNAGNVIYNNINAADPVPLPAGTPSNLFIASAAPPGAPSANVSIPLGSGSAFGAAPDDACLDLWLKLPYGWFVVGMRLSNEAPNASGGARHAKIYAEETSTATPIPTLNISYTA